ncbi:NADH dehydrogenase [ubiquinone] 1 beta subcomplex subunit 5, mitochondrial [Bombus vosnesenskii]|uniref:NADH dehydrogenase [ubiquinone] 1 beta subcomplex subunit 5, mitochondrial n=1 Tax=Bombus vosnesenskii TaxID=207650 RepID=A0A6J3KAK7_9HYME|nr:NADH dehydrogenase [ubiquinone] 1 beta subcomplex subunit 5, mitochondrial [Bombus vosnesenskii]
MAVVSRLLLATNRKLFHTNELLGKLLRKNNNYALQNQGVVRRMSDHRVMEVTASRWQWHKTKDWLHFYIFMGVIPAGLLIFYCNVFIGPATLEPIPEGYIPKQWEYYRHPITRFLSRYMFPNTQMEYEKFLHKAKVAANKRQLYMLKTKILEQIQDYEDYRYWSFKDGSAKEIIALKQAIDNRELDA